MRPLPEIDARGLGRRHPSSSDWLLNNASLHVRSGDRLAVVGPSGSGKTLLLRALALLDPLDAGSVLWRDKPVSGNRVPQYRSHVMYVHQRPAPMEGIVEQNLRQPFELAVHRNRQFDRDRVVRALKHLGRDPSFLSKSSRDLSGGESQIVALLRAIQLDPVVLLVDEPTAALDGDAAAAVETLVLSWLEEQPERRATVWVSHSPAQSARVARTILRMDKGRLINDA